MKKFKLIEEYPNCKLKVGDVITFYDDDSTDSVLYITLEEVEKWLYKYFAPIKAEDYKFEYSSPDRIGSIHWFNTVVGFAGRAAEFMIEHPEHEQSKKYPKMIQDVISDLFKAKEDGLIKLR